MEISVIVPVYNVKKYVRQCLESILKQTFQDFEIIVVDDCSTDGSFSVCQQISELAGGKIRLLKQPRNMGVATARNAGMSVARGAYIAFVDGDDMLVPNALQILYEVARKWKADVVHTGLWYEFSDDGGQMKPATQEMCPPTQEIAYLPKNLPARIQAWITSSILASACGKLFHRDFLLMHGLQFSAEVYYGEDALFVFQAVCLTESMVRIPDIVYAYRQNMASVTHQPPNETRLSKDAANLVSVIRILSEFMQKLEFCRNNAFVQFEVLDYWFRVLSNRSKNVYEKLPPEKLYSMLYEGLQPVFGENTGMVVCLYQAANAYRGGCLQILGNGAKDFRNLWEPEVINIAKLMDKERRAIQEIRSAIQL